MSFVDYDGTYDVSEVETLSRRIETAINDYVQKGGAVGIRQVPASEAPRHSDYLPVAILEKYENVHLATYPDGFAICCGGTHVTDVAQIGPMKVTRIKKKDGKIRVSYALAEQAA
jgi:Ser-tRNA(Ala) deacylase AlaX